MADIFLSCEHEERDRLMFLLCRALQPRWSIWCDTGIGSGKPWAEAWDRLVDMERARAHEERGLTEDKPRAEIDYVRALWADPSRVAAEEGLARLRGDAPAARPA